MGHLHGANSIEGEGKTIGSFDKFNNLSVCWWQSKRDFEVLVWVELIGNEKKDKERCLVTQVAMISPLYRKALNYKH